MTLWASFICLHKEFSAAPGRWKTVTIRCLQTPRTFKKQVSGLRAVFSCRKPVLGTQKHSARSMRRQWSSDQPTPGSLQAVLGPCQDGLSYSAMNYSPCSAGRSLSGKLLLSPFLCLCLSLQWLCRQPGKRGQLGSSALASAVPWQPASQQSPLIMATGGLFHLGRGSPGSSGFSWSSCTKLPVGNKLWEGRREGRACCLWGRDMRKEADKKSLACDVWSGPRGLRMLPLGSQSPLTVGMCNSTMGGRGPRIPLPLTNLAESERPNVSAHKASPRCYQISSLGSCRDAHCQLIILSGLQPPPFRLPAGESVLRGLLQSISFQNDSSQKGTSPAWLINDYSSQKEDKQTHN